MELLNKKAMYLSEGEEVWITARGLYSYEVSTTGRVRRYFESKRNVGYYREPNQIPNVSNGLVVNINDDKAGVRSQKSVAKLVYESFMDVDLKSDIIFVDGDNTNCSLVNLITPEEISSIYKYSIKKLINNKKSNK